MSNDKWEKIGTHIPTFLEDPFMMGPLLDALPPGIEQVDVRNTETGEIRTVVAGNGQDLGDAIAKGQFTDKDDKS